MTRNIFVVITLLVALITAPVAAQRAVRDGLLLARICAHEAGWDADDTGDCAAIHEVLWRGAQREGMSYRSYAYAYAGRALRGETSRGYFAALNEAGDQPSTWPRYRTIRRSDGSRILGVVPPFSHYRAQWLELLAYANRIVAAPPDDSSPCASPVHDWGGAMDRDRAARIGLIEIECGDTRNDFYARPSIVRASL